MPRRVTLVLAGALVAATPAAAQAAETYTVDGSAAAGCSAAKVCKTLTAAVAAVAAGDTIVVQPGTYKEPGKVTVTKANVTIQGTAGKTAILPVASAAAGDPTISLAQGGVLDGLTIATAANAGPAVLVTGRDTVFRNGAILRIGASTEDTAAYAVDAGVAAGTSTIQSATIINGPPGQTNKTAAAVQGNATSTLAISDAFVLSGPGNGPALALTGNDKTAGGEAISNAVVRTTLVAQRAAADALTFTSGATSTVKKALALDSAALLPGTSGAGLRAESLANALGTPTDTAGDLKVVASHVTIAGGDKPFVVAAGSGGQTAVGNVDVTFDRSIVHGANQGTVSSFTPAAPLPIPLPLPTGTANTAKVVVSNSDTTQNAVGAAGGKATVAVPGKTTTPDAALFVDLPKLNVHLRQDAPVIDKGGPAIAGESDKDADGQPRVNGAASDLGADEFVNRPPVAAATVSPAVGTPDTDIAFDASKAADPEAGAGGGIVTYRWNFGDGTIVDTATPTTSHRYAKPGSYTPKMLVIDNLGTASDVLVLPVVAIRDATAPVVALTSPTSGKVFTVFVKRTTKTASGKQRKVTKLDPKRVAKVRFAGKATDANGIASVELSIRRVSTAKAAATSCVFLDGKTTFRSRSCAKPLFFVVKQTAGSFSYRLKSTLKPKAGLYEVSVRATDGGGLAATSKPVRFRLK
jgi:PKD repeat protein